MEREMEYEEILLVKASWYYYMEGLTQQEIGEYLGIPRLRVNRLLDKARKNGVIQFSVRSADSSRMHAERSLIHRFHLKDAFVVPAAFGSADVNENVAQGAAMYVNDHLEHTSFINMGYGDTPSRVLNHLANMTETPINVVSLTGGVNYYLPNTKSDIFNAKLYLTPAPLIVSNPAIVDVLMKEQSISQVINMASLAQMSIVGIGALNENATIIKNGSLTRNDFLLLQMKGAVGDILCHFIDENGDLIPNDLEQRLISTSLDQLKGFANTVGVAAGADKAKAILAALRGGYLNTLITDETTAQLVLELAGNETPEDGSGENI